MMKHTIVLFCANARLIILGERTISKFLLLKSQQAHTIYTPRDSSPGSLVFVP